MREIKFRMWDTEYKEMVYDPNAGLVYGESINGPFRDDDRIFMQYTGLKDKNGVEIYVSDLLSNGYIHEVVFENGSFVAVGRGNGLNVTLSDADMSEYEVVGNIYENPELLKE